MPHERPRHIVKRIKEFQSFWPVVGIIGPRQVGKTTLIREQLTYKTYKTLDDDDTRDQAKKSARVFLSQYERPLVVDEITKAPDLFDGIKSIVDKKRIPNQFLISGSVQFSSKLDIRESLTGRIGILTLNPLNISEAREMSPPSTVNLNKQEKSRFSIEDMIHHAKNGGFPVPMFIRDKTHLEQYWSSWLETTIYRDVSRFFKSRFDPEFAYDVVRAIARAFAQGELATLSNLKITDSRKVRRYLDAFEMVFLVGRNRIHDMGVGTDSWFLADSGLAYYLMKQVDSDATLISNLRHLLWNETKTYLSLRGIRDERTYFKSAKGSPVDWVWDGIPFKIVTSMKSVGWEEKALLGAMKKLKSKTGYLIAPIDESVPPKKGKGIGILPWATWS